MATSTTESPRWSSSRPSTTRPPKTVPRLCSRMPDVAQVELGIFSRTFDRETLPAVLDAVVKHGFDQLHLSLRSASVDPFHRALDSETPAQIRREIEDHDLELVGISCTFNAIQPDQERRGRETGLACELISRVPELGTRFASLCTGTRDPDDMWRGHPANDDPAAWSDLRATMTRLVEAAEAAD